jgi:hypothetical protein
MIVRIYICFSRAVHIIDSRRYLQLRDWICVPEYISTFYYALGVCVFRVMVP